jgi:beta-phosphoglucomutase-like phosphatase (HAD superfamily)
MQAFRGELFKREYLPQVRAFPGVRALFERIHAAGQTIVLASSGEADEVGEHKRIANIADLVDDETTSSDAERSKPFPDIFEAAFATFRCRLTVIYRRFFSWHGRPACALLLRVICRKLRAPTAIGF